MRWGSSLVLLVLAVAACGSSDLVEVAGVVRDGRTGAPLPGALVQASGGAETEADEQGRFSVPVPAGDDRVVRAVAVERCPGEAHVEVRPDGSSDVTVHLFPRLEVEEEHLQVGFGRELVIEARTRCDEEENLEWARLSGPPLDDGDLVVEDGGRRARLTIPPLEEVVDLDPRLSVVALSRASRLEYRLELRATLGGHDERRVVRVTAASPSAGIYQVPTGVDVYLDGGERARHQWSITAKPEGSIAELVDPTSRTPHLRADRFGQYLIRYEPTALEINVMAGAFQDVPRDCGREGCHAPETRGWETTRHASTLQRGLEGELGPEFGERCFGCHSTGYDPGIENGGLHEVTARIRYTPAAPHPGAWEEAPRQVRRFGSVWCSACHGPGRILPPPFHWEYGAKYQVGVCAQCHDSVGDPDAANDSWHVREWRRAPMSALVGGTESGPAVARGCARCHSVQGFIAWLDRGDKGHVPEAATVEAVTCVACHDPHDGSRPHALRRYDSVSFGEEEVGGLGAGAICAACHQASAPDDDAPSIAPHAPQADVLLGRGSILVRTRGGVHARLAESCVACHMPEPEAADPLRGRAGGHTFSVRDLDTNGARAILSPGACSACHGSGVPPQAIGGFRDWDGDGRSDNVGEEFDRALTRVRNGLRSRIAQARVRDGCGEGRLATDFVERDASLLLVGEGGVLLGDCDGSGAFSGSEQVVGVGQLSRALRHVVWDVALIEKDGSRGRHNPELAFAILRAAELEVR